MSVVHTGGSKTGGPATVCKICWHNVFNFQAVGWKTGRYPGIAHQDCLDAEAARALQPSK